MKVYTATITDAGKAEIARLLACAGKNPADHNLDAWAAEIAEKLEDDAALGNRREVEMRGIRSPQGYTLFFDGEDENFVTYTTEEIDD